MNIEMSTTNKNIKSCDNKLTKTLSSVSTLSSANALEVDTLSDMVTLSKQCVSFLDQLQLNRQRIIQDIKNNENNFFEKNPEIISQFNALFDPTIFKSKVIAFSEEIEDTVDSYCCHDYVADLIDIEYDKSRRVIYCQLCELTKK
jgi:hypothetical protein